MSLSAQGGSGQPEDKPQGLSKFMRRASKVLKRGSSKRGSISGITDIQAGSGSDTPTALASQPRSASPPSADQPATVEPAPFVPAAISQSIRDINKSHNTASYRNAPTHVVTSGEMQQERARALFAKYGLTLEPDDWTPPARGDAERVEKMIRMRIHRHCHQCQTTFGRDKVCSNCQHIRCAKCPRYPAKKKKVTGADGLAASAGPGLGGGLLAVDKRVQSKTGEVPLTMPGRTPGKVLVRRGPVQRVRRTCHRCETIFQGKCKACGNCKHERCPKCSREPPKPKKYPGGYPGDTEETFPLAERSFKRARENMCFLSARALSGMPPLSTKEN
ncbi:hypothetical protein MMC08_001612 [Hypocenomyce scalaris]|nr:hypothetical protein [Hypocenomyce scalaris]